MEGEDCGTSSSSDFVYAMKLKRTTSPVSIITSTGGEVEEEEEELVDVDVTTVKKSLEGDYNDRSENEENQAMEVMGGGGEMMQSDICPRPPRMEEEEEEGHSSGGEACSLFDSEPELIVPGQVEESKLTDSPERRKLGATIKCKYSRWHVGKRASLEQAYPLKHCPHSCPYCEEGFKLKPSLRQHTFSSHAWEHLLPHLPSGTTREQLEAGIAKVLADQTAKPIRNRNKLTCTVCHRPCQSASLQRIHVLEYHLTTVINYMNGGKKKDQKKDSQTGTNKNKRTATKKKAPSKTEKPKLVSCKYCKILLHPSRARAHEAKNHGLHSFLHRLPPGSEKLFEKAVAAAIEEHLRGVAGSGYIREAVVSRFQCSLCSAGNLYDITLERDSRRYHILQHHLPIVVRKLRNLSLVNKARPDSGDDESEEVVEGVQTVGKQQSGNAEVVGHVTTSPRVIVEEAGHEEEERVELKPVITDDDDKNPNLAAEINGRKVADIKSEPLGHVSGEETGAPTTTNFSESSHDSKFEEDFTLTNLFDPSDFPAPCPYCKKVFQIKPGFNQHLALTHAKDLFSRMVPIGTSNRVLVCSLESHFTKFTRGGKTRWECNVCKGYYFCRQVDVYLHLRDEHRPAVLTELEAQAKSLGPVDASLEKDPYSCPLCNKCVQFFSRKAIGDHLKSAHHRLERYARFFTRKNL